MRTKLVALGNVLIKDDGIAIEIAKVLEDELNNLGIEVIYGETDIGYCITRIEEDDYLILLDAARTGAQPGEITLFPLDADMTLSGFHQHDLNFFLMLRWYLHNPKGILMAIEIDEIGFDYGLSQLLQNKRKEIAKNILELIYRHTSV